MGDSWRALAEELGLAADIIFYDVVPNEQLEQLYAMADLFVLPAIVDDRGDTEGLGVVLVEALSFKTPVVASNVGGIPDVIINNQTGLLVPEKDPQALAEAAMTILRDAKLAAQLAENGLEHATSYFNWERITDQLSAVYNVAIGKK